MKGKRIKGEEGNGPDFLKYSSYSIDEILAAGGTTAFAKKLNKNPANISTQMKTLPEDAFLSEEEAKIALELLKETK